MEVLTEIITSVGFPIGMCIIMAIWIKITHDDHREDVKELQKNHTEETDAFVKAINENTLVLQKLIDKIGDNDNEQ